MTPFPTSTSVGYDISDFFGRVLWPAPRPFFLEALLSSGDLSAAMYLQSSISTNQRQTPAARVRTEWIAQPRRI
jgi:hypothetical protein